MEISLTPGLSRELSLEVKEPQTAHAYGSGLLKVYATPAMIAFMEKAALKAVAEHLPQGYSTVGTHVNIKHVKATPMGMKVWAKATLTEVEGKKLTFETEARDEEGIIGMGVHKRYIINESQFMQMFSGKDL